MDRELLDDQGVHERNDTLKPQDDQGILTQQRQERTQETAIKEKELNNIVGVLADTVDHFFPRFNAQLDQIYDRRNQDLIIYDKKVIVWTALSLMFTKLGSRRAINNDLRGTGNCRLNLQELSGCCDLKTVPHGDTVDYFLAGSKEEGFERLQAYMLKELLRGRVLEPYRLLNKYHTIAVDGVHTHTFDYEHCPNCLVKERSDTGKKQWSHNALQASLVTNTGLCLPITNVWIENAEKEYNKQDCELNAFKRLVKKLRKTYSRLPICFLLDGLYAVEPVFECLRQNDIEYIIVFKEGRSSNIYQWVMNWKERFAKENIVTQKREKTIALRNKRAHSEKFIRRPPTQETAITVQETTYTWMTGIKNLRDERSFNVMTCKEIEGGKKNCDYVWLVSDGLGLSKETVKELTQRGRDRWKIENEGFNTQKNGGYSLEHLYSRDPVSMKIFYLLIGIAHTIDQLIQHGSLIAKEVYGSIKSIAKTLFDNLRYSVLKKPPNRLRIQIRLCSDHPGRKRRWNTS